MRIYLAVIGSACVAGALWLLLRRIRVVLHGAITNGHVESHESREDEGSVFYLPVVSFTDTLGREHRFTAVAGGTRRSLPVGSEVLVRYLPASPDVAFIASFLHMWAAPLGFAVLGAGAFLAYAQITGE